MQSLDKLELVSNSSIETFPNNTLGNFTTKLHQNVIFDPDDCVEVALTEISFTRSWYNVRNDQEIGIKLDGEIKFNADAYINEGYYPDPKAILDAVNTQLEKY